MAALSWADLSNIASTAPLTGVDFFELVRLVIKAAKNPRILKKQCRLFGQHLEHVGGLLEIIMPAELMEDTRIREPLKRLENAIKAACVPVDICRKSSKFYLYTSGCYIAKCLKEAQEEVDECLKIIPLLVLAVLAAMQQQERRVNAREDEEWKKNIAAQMAAIQSFMFKQLLDEACKDITDKTDYDDFAKKWGHDERFKVLGRKERESLFNERVSLRKTLKEKVKAGQVAPIYSFSYWPEGNPSNVPLHVGEVLDDGVPEDFIEDLIMPVRDSLPVEQLDKGNPSNLPLLVGELLDYGVPDYLNFIEDLIMSAGDSLPVEQLIEEYEKRNRLPLLKKVLEHLVREGSQDVHVHSALDKIRIDTNDKPEHSLETNLYYDSYVVGKHSEKRNPTLAVASYWRGQCDDELIDVTNKKFLFELQARYVVERADPQLWKRVLALENPHRRKLIDRVASTVLPESKNSDQVSATVKAFINADRPHELIELLEKIVLQNSTFSGNPNLQDLLIHTAIEADRSRLMDYINRLDNFDGPAIGEIAIGKKLYEEAFNIFKKFNLNVQAVNVLLDHIRSFERAYQFASRVKKDVVWSQVAKAQLREGLLSAAIESFIRADDATQFPDVIRVAEEASLYHDLVKYLFMVKKNVKEPEVHTELNAKLASAFVKLRQFQKAVDAARKVNRLMTWKEVCFACVDAEEFRLAQLCGFNIIVQVNELKEVSDYYRNRGRSNELISLMEEGLGLERWHMGLLTELRKLYSEYRPEKLKEYTEMF